MEKKEYELSKEVIDYKFDLNSSTISIYRENIDKPLIRYTGEFEFKVNGSKVVVTEKLFNASNSSNKIFKFNRKSLFSLILESVYEVKSVVKKEKNIELVIPTYENSNIPVDFSNLSIRIDSLTGDLNIENLKAGKLTLDVSSGNVNLKKVESKFVDVDSTVGDIDLQSVNSDNLKLNTSSGNISFSVGNTKNINVDTCAGDVSFKNVDSDIIHIDTTSGDIMVDNGVSKDFSFSTTVGDLRLTNVETDRLTINTSSGDMIIRDGYQKEVLITTTIGDVSMDGISPEFINVDTSSGDVEIGILESIMNYETNLSSSSGDVISYSLEKTPPQILFNKKHMVDVETITGDIKVLFKGRKKSC